MCNNYTFKHFTHTFALQYRNKVKQNKTQMSDLLAKKAMADLKPRITARDRKDAETQFSKSKVYAVTISIRR